MNAHHGHHHGSSHMGMAHGYGYASSHGYNRHRQMPVSQDYVSFIDTKGVHHQISLHYNPNEQGAVVQCCDPWNERIYYLPIDMLEKTSGLETHVHNRTGRRAQICMKYQQQKCNMREKCLQIHADYMMVEALRNLYHADKKAYVSEVLAVDVSDMRNDVLSFKYSEIEPGYAKEMYRKKNGKPAVLCTQFINRGMCSGGSQCQQLHIGREKYLKAKAARSRSGDHMHPKHHHLMTYQKNEWGEHKMYESRNLVGGYRSAVLGVPLAKNDTHGSLSVSTFDDEDRSGSDSNSSHETASWLAYTDSPHDSCHSFGPMLSRVDLSPTFGDTEQVDTHTLNTDLEGSEDVKRMLDILELDHE
eukprot:TRINITY_DN16489_c0_g1_i1.p1 TRINITY_DN16489_c0_g1~~TRINITY_DN16489_c0_g1_i1.p1  ORF type:complete len:359 (+),score=139.86 TRINITY_DN16489_c0_g1_i1:163-1239(+)